MGQAAAQGEAYWRVHVEAWRDSGQSRGEYCALHGLSRKTFGWWAWRLDRQERPRRRISCRSRSPRFPILTRVGLRQRGTMGASRSPCPMV